MAEINIDGQKIGKGNKPYIVAELSANHNGSMDRAIETLIMAKNAGADAAKLQTYTPDTMTINCDKPDFQINGGLWDGYNLYELYRAAHTPYAWHRPLFEKAKEIGLTIFSTPFDESAVELLEELNTPAYKIASFELTDLPLIARVAKTKKPLIMSTGLANLEEIEEAVSVAKRSGADQLVLLHCVSGYPSPVEQSNILTIKDMAHRFDCVIGLSDHTLGTAVPVAAVALGAHLIEKHVTLSRADKGPDSEFSLEPDELRRLCVETKTAWQALGEPGYDTKPVEQANLRFRRSLYFVRSLKAGDVISKNDIRRIRPGFGLAPKHFDALIGRKMKVDVDFGTAVSWEQIDNE